jgi:nondiscriminating glutamyl-tRNA synthetase
MSVRVRFAPSPTGFLHIGGARTALFNWIYARHTGGTFILRLEDTDTARNTQEAVEVILQGLRWLGLEWDEGPVTGNATGPSKGNRGPYFQSQRSAIYKQRVQELLAKDLAYDDDGAIKFRMTREPVVVHDLVVGRVARALNEEEKQNPDFVIVRSDGQPVFHLVNVVDDIEMGITHVIRGEDHLANTAKHLALFRALGANPPQYAHIPLILNSNGSKMSKRDEGASLLTYIDEGYVPEAVVNYLLLLGWSPKNNREIMTLQDAVELFDLPQILRHNARFDMTKLQWMTGEYIRTGNPDRYYELGIEKLRQSGVDLSRFDPAYVRAALLTCRERVKRFSELMPWVDFYFVDDVPLPAEVVSKDFHPDNRPRLMRLREALAGLEIFNAVQIEASLKSVATALGVKAGILVHPTRLACTGKTVGPSLYHLMEVLGKDRVLKRLDRALIMAQ